MTQYGQPAGGPGSQPGYGPPGGYSGPADPGRAAAIPAQPEYGQPGAYPAQPGAHAAQPGAYPVQPGYPQPGQPTAAPLGSVSRPAVLAVAVWAGVASAVLTIIGALVLIVSGKDSIRAYVQDTVNSTLGTSVDPGVIDAAVGDQLNSVYHTLVVKAVFAIVVAVAVLIFALLARNAGMFPRVGFAVAIAIGWCSGGLLLGDADALPNVSVLTAGIAPLLGLIAIVCLFLPASNRYAKARKTAR